MVVLDPRSGAVLNRVHAGVLGSDARALAVDQSANLVYATNGIAGTVSVLDGRSGRLLRTISLGRFAAGIVLDAAHHRAVVSTVVGPGTRDELVVIDTLRATVVRRVPVDPPMAYDAAVDPQTGHILFTTSSVHDPARDAFSWLPPWLRERIPSLPAPAPTVAPTKRILSNELVTLDPLR